MLLCSGDINKAHEEVCYEGKTCPVCEIIDEQEYERKDAAETIARLEKELEEAQNG